MHPDKRYHSSDPTGNFVNQSRVEIDEPELRRRHQQQRFRGGVHSGQVSGGPPDAAHVLAKDTAERPEVRACDRAGTGRLPGRARRWAGGRGRRRQRERPQEGGGEADEIGRGKIEMHANFYGC